MSDVRVPFGDNSSETAILLLAAAVELDEPAEAVRTQSDSTFLVDEKLAKKAGVKYGDEVEGEAHEPKPAKKAAAKKAAANKKDEE